jgi:hypothetical protein
MSENTIQMIGEEYAGSKRISAYNPTTKITFGGNTEAVVALMRANAHYFDDHWIITTY